MEVLARIAAYVALGTLLWSGISHLLAQAAFVQAIRSQRLNPPPGLLAAGVTFLEVSIGGVGILAIVSGDGSASVAKGAALAAAVLYFVFGAFAFFLVRRRPGALCGCAGTEASASVWTVFRALVLSAAAVVAAGSAASSTGVSVGTEGVLTVLPALGLGTVLWLLPSALEVPIFWRRPATDVQGGQG